MRLPYDEIEVFNVGDDVDNPGAAYLKFSPSGPLHGSRRFTYQIEDVPPNRVVNGKVLDEPEPSRRPRIAQARVRVTGK